MLNYEVDPALLAGLVPRGTELDAWRGRTYLSVVGFLFLDTRVLGIPIPLHRNFEEVNLRFYVRRQAAEGWRRAVVFVKEIVPRPAIAWVARMRYNENYVAHRMDHAIAYAAGEPGRVAAVTYRWHTAGRANRLSMSVSEAPQPLRPGSEAEFIAEHYWGYARQRDGGTVEYQVAHPPWRAAPAVDAELDCDVAQEYGEQYVPALRAAPTSAFLAEGSAVTVSQGVRLVESYHEQ
jgi:hypothetical protein